MLAAVVNLLAHAVAAYERRACGIERGNSKNRKDKNQEVITDLGVYIPPVNGVCVLCV